MHACQEGHLEIVKYLIAKGADVNAGTREGKTPLMFACQVRQPCALLSTLVRRKATPLWRCISSTRVAALTTPDAWTAKRPSCSEWIRSVLLICLLIQSQGHVECVKAMIARGANPAIQLQNGRTSLDMAKTMPMRAALQAARPR